VVEKGDRVFYQVASPMRSGTEKSGAPPGEN
jgi:hypothetical protein